MSRLTKDTTRALWFTLFFGLATLGCGDDSSGPAGSSGSDGMAGTGGSGASDGTGGAAGNSGNVDATVDAFCGNFGACVDGFDVAGCRANAIPTAEGLAMVGCQDEYLIQLDCQAGLDCEELEANPGPCESERVAVLDCQNGT